MTESQLSICTWADATFGPASDASIAARALVEADELVEACTSEPRAATTRIGMEAADVIIVLARLGRSLGLDVIRISCEDVRRGGPRTIGVDRSAKDARSDLRVARDKLAADGPPIDRYSVRCCVLWALENLADVAWSVDVSLAHAIDEKMAVNRARRWTLDGHGHGSHVKDGAS